MTTSPKLPTDAMTRVAMAAAEQAHVELDCRYSASGICVTCGAHRDDGCTVFKPEVFEAALTAALAVAPRDEALAKSDDLIPPPTRFLSERDHLDMMHAMRRSGKVVRSAESADDAFNAGLEEAAKIAIDYFDGGHTSFGQTLANLIRARKRSAK